MATTDFGWLAPDMELVINTCDEALSIHANSGGRTPQFDGLIDQVMRFRSIWRVLRDDIQRRDSKVFMSHTPIVQTWSKCQRFLSTFVDHTKPQRPKLTALYWEPNDVHRSNGLQAQLNAHIQQLTLYRDLLELQSRGSNARRREQETRGDIIYPRPRRANTAPVRHGALGESPELDLRRPFRDEQSEVKQLQNSLRSSFLRSSLLPSRDDFEDPRAEAAQRLEVELTNMHYRLEERSTRREISQRAGVPPQNAPHVDATLHRHNWRRRLLNHYPPLTHEQITDVELTFTLCQSGRTRAPLIRMSCSLDAIFSGTELLLIMVLRPSINRRPQMLFDDNHPLPRISFQDPSLKRPTPFVHWQGPRLQDAEYPFVVDLSGECLNVSGRLEDLAYRFRNETSCNRFQELVYGKTFEASVSIRKLKQETRRGNTTLCSDAVLSFWSNPRDPRDPAPRVADCTMLYFTFSSGVRIPHEKSMGDFSRPRKCTEAHRSIWELPSAHDGSGKWVIEFASRNWKTESPKLRELYQRLR